ncbi:pre-mRNA cleavage complex 2 protein Pcf11 [Clinocottus analis]|uniref:pre-mRNA cleavage complex 2 protein Pcf11 n=1 Tax=Clinocottus analis TaxID=304258 RepID=UPI0035C0B2AA
MVTLIDRAAAVGFPGSLGSKMADEAAREDACREYQSSLEDLTFNSKPHINMLTILAEENLNFAKDIVAIIEAQISKAPSAEKLPVLYLVDSIVKNVGGEYLAVFAKNLITSFICVFEKVDENTRKSLFKLRSTWDDVFPLKRLYALDLRVHSVDPAWPIKPLPPTVTANASIHVNPKFLKQPDEVPSPQPAPAKPAPAALTPPAPKPAPVPVSAVAVSQSSLTQEQLIRQQLLAKQKQLLELQQKKIELELQQTNEQLGGGFVIPVASRVSPPAPLRSAGQMAPVVRSWIPPSTPADAKPPTRDPRLNRGGQPRKEQHSGKKDGPAAAGSPAATPEKSARPDKVKTPRKEAPDDKPKSKPPSPMTKGLQGKNKTEAEAQKSADGTKKDPRLKKRPQDKTTGDEELKRRCTDKKEREEAARVAEPQRVADPHRTGEPHRAAADPHRAAADPHRAAADPHRAAADPHRAAADPHRAAADPHRAAADPHRAAADPHRAAADPHRAAADPHRAAADPHRAAADPHRAAADTHRAGKGKLANGSVGKHDRGESAEKPEFKTGGNARTHARKRTRSRSRSRSPGSSAAASSSPKRKDRRSPKSRTRSSSLSPSPSSHKAGKPRRVGPGSDHGKLGRGDRPAAAKKSNPSESRRSKRPAEDRHAESRDPHKEAKEAPHRWRSGWEENKHPKLPEDSHVKPGPQRHKPYGPPARPPAPRTPKHRLSVDANLQIPEALNSASKKDLLRRASKRLESGEISQEDFLNMAHQIKHFFQYQEEKQRSDGWDDDPAKKLLGSPAPPQTTRGGMDAAELSYLVHKSRLRKTQVTHRAAWEGEESPEDDDDAKTGGSQSAGRPKYSRTPQRDWQAERRSKEREEPRLIEEYNHGKEFPALKSLPGLRFRRRADPREPSEREWNSPLTERPRFDEREEPKSGYDAPRGYGALPADARRPEGPAGGGPAVHRSCPSPEAAAPRFERERLSPLHQKDPADMSPIPRFESPNSEHSDDGPLNLDALNPKSILKAAPNAGPLAAARQRSDSPGHTPPHAAGHPPPPRYDGPPGHMGPGRPHPAGWYESGGGPGRYDDPSRFEGPHHQGPGRFGPPHHNMPERFDGPHMPHGGLGRYNGPPQGPGRFEGPGHFEGPMQRFDAPRCFENNMAAGPGSGPMGFQQQRPMRFDGPQNQMGPMRFDGAGPMRFESPVQPGPRFDAPHQQGGPPLYEAGPLRFQHGLQPPMRPMAPPLYDPAGPQQGFGMNPQFSGGPMAFPAQPAGSFNMQPGPAPFSQPGPAPFYNPGGPAVNMQQPVNMLGNLSQPFLPQNPVPFGQQAPPENHFGQVDVNDLLSKLISNGIIKPSQPDAAPPVSAEPTSTPPVAPPTVVVVEEEEEEPEEEEDDDLPDLTSFTVDDMKQRFESVVTKLYSGNQCCLCSMRFTATQTDLYADHLDWHFRQNHAGKVAGKKITHRRWYYGLRDWVEFEEIADLEERAKSHFFEKENEVEVQKSQQAAKEKEFLSVKATKDQVGELCEICQEPFETYWVEEEEDWFLKDALRVDDKNFHPACFEDYKNTSSYLDVTPSPSKLLAEHPLSAFIKSEEDEEEEASASCAVAAAAVAAITVKQEVESAAACELPEVKKEEVLTDCDQSEA